MHKLSCFLAFARRAIAGLMVASMVLSVFAYFPLTVKADSPQPTPEQQQALDRVNYYRALAGVPAAHLNPALLQSAGGHALYVSKNGWSGDPHGEDPKKEGFVGADMMERASKFGYTGVVNEDMANLGAPVAAVDALMNTISHRVPILEPAYTDIGYGFATGKNAVDVLSFGSTRNSWYFDPPIIQWPPNDYKSFGTTYWGENPSPFTNVTFPMGNPVSLTYRGKAKLELVPEECKLLDDSGNPVDSVAATGSSYTTRGTIMLAAKKPLAKNHAYRVTMVYKLDGQKQSRTWSFSTGPVVQTGVTLSAGLKSAPASIQNLWEQVDGEVAQGQKGRTWLYGPDVNKAYTEDYVEGPNGKRSVWYFDKVRLEITRPDGDQNSAWYVTSGLLPKELMTGKMQVGDNKFVDRPPAQVPVAGDLTNNPGSPTYASLAKVASLNNDRRADNRQGQVIKEGLNGASVVAQAQPPVEVKYSYYDQTLGHNIPDVFMNSFKNLPREWLFIVGLPLTEAYWTKVKVGGVDKDVLLQVFERRVLTYTPSNSPEWQVEMGNVGLHYMVWRYPPAVPA
ncbi:MAG TPA: CAP domain-containing protein [Chloroflexia bacterium]|nr:CAP domain-containing protein [Chloroflexia bacterium]